MCMTISCYDQVSLVSPAYNGSRSCKAVGWVLLVIGSVILNIAGALRWWDTLSRSVQWPQVLFIFIPHSDIPPSLPEDHRLVPSTELRTWHLPWGSPTSQGHVQPNALQKLLFPDVLYIGRHPWKKEKKNKQAMATTTLKPFRTVRVLSPSTGDSLKSHSTTSISWGFL